MRNIFAFLLLVIAFSGCRNVHVDNDPLPVKVVSQAPNPANPFTEYVQPNTESKIFGPAYISAVVNRVGNEAESHVRIQFYDEKNQKRIYSDVDVPKLINLNIYIQSGQSVSFKSKYEFAISGMKY